MIYFLCQNIIFIVYMYIFIIFRYKPQLIWAILNFMVDDNFADVIFGTWTNEFFFLHSLFLSLNEKLC